MRRWPRSPQSRRGPLPGGGECASGGTNEIFVSLEWCATKGRACLGHAARVDIPGRNSGRLNDPRNCVDHGRTRRHVPVYCWIAQLRTNNRWTKANSVSCSGENYKQNKRTTHCEVDLVLAVAPLLLALDGVGHDRIDDGANWIVLPRAFFNAGAVHFSSSTSLRDDDCEPSSRSKPTS